MRSHRALSLLLPLTLAAACSDLPTTAAPDAKPAESHNPAARCVNFEPPLAAGTVWGAPVAQPPLTLVHVENGIRVYTEKFYLAGGGTTYREARIGIPPTPFSAGQAARTLHINLIFDFSGVGFAPSSYSFDYLDVNGPQSYENLRVNASPVFIGELDSPPPFIGPVSVTVAAGPFAVPPIGDRGTLKLSPNFTRLTVGGQDLWLDHVCANP